MKKAVIIIGCIIAALFLAAIIFFGVMFLKRVTPEDAQHAAQKHTDDVRAKITSVQGYTIVKQDRPTVDAVQDEMGADDYTLTARFLVKKQPAGSTEASVNFDAIVLAKKLPKNGYGITVENAPHIK